MTISRTICLGFLAVIIVGSILLTMPFSGESGTWNSPLVALFTSTSAVCVTGLSVVDPGTYFSFWGQLIILLLVQIGGLGYMTTTTFLLLLLGRRFDLKQKFAIQESFDRPFLQGSANLLRSIFATTLLFELTGIILMFGIFAKDHGVVRGLWLAIFHSVSAWNNAGFSLFKDNLMGYHSSIIINLTIAGLIIFGGIGYQVIIEMYLWLREKIRRSPRRFAFSLNFKVAIHTTIILLLLGTVAFLLTESYNGDTMADFSIKDKILASFFQSVTTRTAGFNTIDNGRLTFESLLFTIILMFIGASPSGTGGGIKTTTLSILATCSKAVLRGDQDVVMYNRRLPSGLILKSVAVVFGSGITVFVATLIISWVTKDFGSIQILFEVVSAFGTVGLSMGITGSLPALAQIAIVITMYIGRVGIVLLIAAIVGDSRPRIIEYPQENLLVG
jgi:trk system potassium uptake protein TrkH